MKNKDHSLEIFDVSFNYDRSANDIMWNKEYITSVSIVVKVKEMVFATRPSTGDKIIGRTIILNSVLK